MFNQHLLQLDLSVSEYDALGGRMGRRAEAYYAALPAYLIARCPLCGAENIERLDTYTLREWPGMNLLNGTSIFGHHAVVRHCEHFALVQRFLNLRGAQSSEIYGTLKGPEIPHVIGYLLKPGPFPVPHAIDYILREEDFYCHAVLHALPVCRPAGAHFEPAYNVFIVTYFAENPSHTREVVRAYNTFFRDPRTPPMFWEPPDGREAWWDLRPWVTAGRLHWIDGSTPDLKLRTRTVSEFPYGDLEGRRYPYFIRPHRLDTWKNPPTIDTARPTIVRFGWQWDYDQNGNNILAGLLVRWEGLKDTPAFRLTRHPVAQYWLPEPETAHRVRSVNILIHEIKAFVTRPAAESGKTEVLLEVHYPPGERPLGVTNKHDEARQWVADANQFLNVIKALRRVDFLRMLRSEDQS
ncbi:MAG TPA: hypothetical protein PKZ84_14675 [Anaerolineae bacterium]|nr:hypothetical protein [Anaerolineae bacterium]HQI85587.1 hypothetical protein [Anaerolineae bacterium]